MKKSFQVLCASLPLALVSCVSERPRDLRVEQVFVADASVLPQSRPHPEAGGKTQHLLLGIELSTTETYQPTGALVVNGFCGEKQGPGYLGGGGDLFTGVASERDEDNDGPTRNRSVRYHYFAFIPIVYMPDRPYPEFAHFDLRTDRHDICLTTGSGTYADVWRSNEVKVPRSMIETALHEPPWTHVPLADKWWLSPEPASTSPKRSW